MKDFKISNKGTTTIFENPVLERLSRTHFAVPVTLYYLASASCLAIAFSNDSISFGQVLWMFPTGLIAFSLVEYLIHRFLFHFNATTEKQQALQYNIHGVHHAFPRDKDRLVMPPLLSIVLAAAFYYLFQWLFADYGLLFFAGFIAGYSTYLVIHYAVHALKPPRNFLKMFWRHHSLHHYAATDAAFSVSFPFWDYLFGTMPEMNNDEKNSLRGKLPDSI
jgi:4-hydroxysphinganine ceramide fatty acyl 2-hydroxylase